MAHQLVRASPDDPLEQEGRRAVVERLGLISQRWLSATKQGDAQGAVMVREERIIE